LPLLPCTNNQHAQVSVERLQRAFQQNPLKVPGESLQLQMSFELAEVSPQIDSIRALYKAADLSIYLAKPNKPMTTDTALQDGTEAAIRTS